MFAGRCLTRLLAGRAERVAQVRIKALKPYRPVDVRFYVDADILGLAKLLVQVRNDVTYPGDPGGVMHRRQRPACKITSPAVLDRDWIPLVAAEGWLIITRDRNIQDNRAEIAAVREYGARMVTLHGPEAHGNWAQLEMFMSRWRDIEGCLGQPGPFIYTVTRTTFKPVQL
jgi:hypothetical protein